MRNLIKQDTTRSISSRSSRYGVIFVNGLDPCQVAWEASRVGMTWLLIVASECQFDTTLFSVK